MLSGSEYAPAEASSCTEQDLMAANSSLRVTFGFYSVRRRRRESCCRPIWCSRGSSPKTERARHESVWPWPPRSRS
jgi:hypothetical protein